MKKYLLLVVPLFILFIGCNTTQTPEENKSDNSDKEAIKACFTKYKNALLETNGDDAVACINYTSKEYYDQIAKMSQVGDSITIQSMNLMDKLIVLTVRHRIPKENILSMDGSGLLKYTIENGMMGTGQLENADIDSIAVTDRTASAELLFGGQKSTIFFNFSREKEGWKIDLTSIFDVSNNSLLKIVKDNHRTEEQFILENLERTTGEAPSPDIWLPLINS